jgi:hypothetical protein
MKKFKIFLFTLFLLIINIKTQSFYKANDYKLSYCLPKRDNRLTFGQVNNTNTYKFQIGLFISSLSKGWYGVYFSTTKKIQNSKILIAGLYQDLLNQKIGLYTVNDGEPGDFINDPNIKYLQDYPALRLLNLTTKYFLTVPGYTEFTIQIPFSYFTRYGLQYYSYAFFVQAFSSNSIKNYTTQQINNHIKEYEAKAIELTFDTPSTCYDAPIRRTTDLNFGIFIFNTERSINITNFCEYIYITTMCCIEKKTAISFKRNDSIYNIGSTIHIYVFKDNNLCI